MSPSVVTDGGLETDLIYLRGQDLPHFASFPLVATDAGRALLTDYYLGYADVARRAGASLLLETPTWRASTDWGALLGYDAEALDRVNRASVTFLRELGAGLSGVAGVEVAGVVGPRGDGYVPGAAFEPAAAAAYHLPQLRAFAEAGAERASAYTLTDVGEAIGIARAAVEVGLPVGIGFTVETDGRLPQGTTLAEAIAAVDADTAPDHFVVNCAHPEHVERGLGDAGSWRERIGGLRVNASTMSHAELDASTELDAGDPQRLAADHARLLEQLPAVRVVGGCCGTDVRHVAALWGVEPDDRVGRRSRPPGRNPAAVPGRRP